MAKRNTPPQYVIRFGDTFFSYKGGKIEWISSPVNANKYASPYAAKSHLRSLTSEPKDVFYVLHE